MNFPTHVMFGIAVGAIFFGKPEIMLLIGLGSAIPDLDREYGFPEHGQLPRAQPHRALCHNFLFLGLIYLVNPFLALGVFLHTFLDAFTTVRDRGVEWLFPFTRLVKSVVYDSDGTRLQLDPAHKIYLLQNPFRRTTRKNQSSCDEQGIRATRKAFARSSERTLGAFRIFRASAPMTRGHDAEFIQ